jgi:uncharacterized protein YkwD
MFHVKHIVFLLFLPAFGASQGYFTLEDKPLSVPSWSDQVVKEQVRRQVDGKGLAAQEISFYYWCNMMRRNPPVFYDKVILPFLKQFPEAKGKEAESLAADLRSADRLPLFEFSKLARDAAMEHSLDLASSYKLSHNSSDGRSFTQRIRINGITKCAGENIYTGKEEGLLALIMLLLDIGMESAGHRKALLSQQYVQMAPAFRPHKTESRSILVQVFTCK